jgi:hypothetical protein
MKMRFVVSGVQLTPLLSFLFFTVSPVHSIYYARRIIVCDRLKVVVVHTEAIARGEKIAIKNTHKKKPSQIKTNHLKNLDFKKFTRIH